ncbi:MAG TPA: hypothetical protein V6C65_38670 [Allocoleopsis sp.]
MSRAVNIMIQNESDYEAVKATLQALFPVQFHGFKDRLDKFQFRVLDSDFFLFIDRELEDDQGLPLSKYNVHVDIYKNPRRSEDEYLLMYQQMTKYVAKRLAENVSSSVLVLDNLQIKIAEFN